MIVFKTDLIPEEYEINEPLENILDEQFPKGDKSRGKALVLFAVANIQIQEERKKVIDQIEKIIKNNNYSLSESDENKLLRDIEKLKEKK